MKKETFKKAFKDSLPVMAGYVFMGMGFGVLLQKGGYSYWWAFFMGLTILSGSMQYVAVDLLTGGASFITSAIMTLMINARYFFYGLSMLDKYRKVKHGRPYLIFTLTDETYSLVSTLDTEKPENKNVLRTMYYFVLSGLNHIYWITGCTLGAFLGESFSFNSQGMEFAMTALFVTIFVDQWIDNKDHFPALFGAILSVICLLIFGAEHFVIPTMIIMTVVLMSSKTSRGAEVKNNE